MRDVVLEKERTLLMFAALVVSLFAIAAIYGGRQILQREIRTNYLSTQPAMCTLEMGEGISADLLDRVRDRADVESAEAHDVIQARVRVGEDWLPMLVFATDSMGGLRLNRYFPERGAWPARPGTFLLERTAAPVLETEVDASILVKLPGGQEQEVVVSGLVHDPGLSPAYQERFGYAYATRATLSQLGLETGLHELRVSFHLDRRDRAEIERHARTLADDLARSGVEVHEIRVPAFEKHPHQLQMETVLLMLLLFACLALFLSAILVATTLSAWLARQTRELAVMKAVGAGKWQIAGIYATFVVVLGGAASLVALPAGAHASVAFAGMISSMLNFTLADVHLTWSNTAIVLVAGVLVPLVVSLFPVWIASRSTVREALTEWGARVPGVGSWGARLPRTLRQLVRRPRRLALSLALLASSGAIFLTSLNVRDGWSANLDKIHAVRHYDVEVRFREPVADSVLAALESVPGIDLVQTWGWSSASLSKKGEIDLVHVWPDKGHGSLALLGLPVPGDLVTFPLIAGRWLRPSDTNGLMLNHIAWIQAGRPEIGSEVAVGSEGRNLAGTLVGVVEEVGSPGVVYLERGVYSRFMANEGRSRMIRVVTAARTPQERSSLLRDLERAMSDRGLPVQMAIPFSELRTAIGDHMKVLIASLFALAGLIAFVGMLGLASVTGMGVMERTREIGILKTLGGTPGRIQRMVVSEALLVGGMSWFLGCVLAVPLTLGMDRLIGSLGFLAPLPLEIPLYGPIVWLVLVIGVSGLAGWIPARRAGNITIVQALAEV